MIFFAFLNFSIIGKGNLRSWLLDENCFDQCAVMYNQGMQVAIAQCTPQELKVVTEREVRFLPPSFLPSFVVRLPTIIIIVCSLEITCPFLVKF